MTDGPAELHDRVRALLRERVGGAAPAFEGEAWLRVRRVMERVERGELSEPDLPSALRDAVNEAIAEVNREERQAGSRSRVFGTHLDAQLRDLPTDKSREDVMFDQRALWERAHAEATATMRRNLGWWKKRRHEGATFAAIAEEHPERVAESTVRGGVARAEKFLRRVMDDLRSQPWEKGDIDYRAVHDAFRGRDTAALAHELAALAPYDRDAQLLNYEGVLHLWSGALDRAERVLKDALVWADKPTLRCLIVNNLGNVAEDAEDFDEALYWYDRARDLDPKMPTPLLNLIGIVCKRASRSGGQFDLHDRARLLHYIDCVTRLLSSRSLDDGERDYLLRRLAENPDFTPARRHTSWRRVRRWLDRARAETPSLAPGANKVSQ